MKNLFADLLINRMIYRKFLQKVYSQLVFENCYSMVTQDDTGKTCFESPKGEFLTQIINKAFHNFQRSSLFPLQRKLNSFWHPSFLYGQKYVYLDISVVLIVCGFLFAFIMIQYFFNYCQSYIYFKCFNRLTANFDRPSKCFPVQTQQQKHQKKV